ncbi:hypothetical protein DENSPDRAFT_855381 [Dentipellis sp. KUC8613]|nr:hypothetical protein DENSPDRAFT_855381 [Dentipellis sp. KUC8613]
MAQAQDWACESTHTEARTRERKQVVAHEEEGMVTALWMGHARAWRSAGSEDARKGTRGHAAVRECKDKDIGRTGAGIGWQGTKETVRGWDAGAQIRAPGKRVRRRRSKTNFLMKAQRTGSWCRGSGLKLEDEASLQNALQKSLGDESEPVVEEGDVDEESDVEMEAEESRG